MQCPCCKSENTELDPDKKLNEDCFHCLKCDHRFSWLEGVHGWCSTRDPKPKIEVIKRK